jgi:ADP-ribose pyrophosphatase YjhB (NUDIX family)
MWSKFREQKISKENEMKGWRGAGVIYFYKDEILIGNESEYLTDTVPNVKEFESTNETDYHTFFSNKAKELSNELNQYVTYDEPLYESDTNKCTCKYRIDYPGEKKHPLGIPKGSVKEEDKTPNETVLREMKEETGIELNEEDLVFLTVDRGYHFYTYVCKDKKKAEEIIEQRVKEHRGEFHKPFFISRSELDNYIHNCNGLTRKVIRDSFLPRYFMMIED